LSFTPRLVALDIDGTLFTNVPSTGQVEETISAPVLDAVRRAYDAGAHVVLATGRSTFGITQVWDQLGLPAAGDRTVSVASNGSVTFRYPPVEVRSTVTFDASEIVRMLLEEVPNALVDAGVPPQFADQFASGGSTSFNQLTSVGDLGENILAQVPEQFRSAVEPLIPAIVGAIHTAFSIATGATFVVGIVTALLAALVVLVFMPAGKIGEQDPAMAAITPPAGAPEPSLE